MENPVPYRLPTTRDERALVRAVRRNDVQAARTLLEKGVEARLLETAYNTLLLVAVIKNCPDMVRLLCEHGATYQDLPPTQRGRNILPEALRRGTDEVVDALLQNTPPPWRPAAPPDTWLYWVGLAQSGQCRKAMADIMAHAPPTAFDAPDFWKDMYASAALEDNLPRLAAIARLPERGKALAKQWRGFLNQALWVSSDWLAQQALRLAPVEDWFASTASPEDPPTMRLDGFEPAPHEDVFLPYQIAKNSVYIGRVNLMIDGLEEQLRREHWLLLARAAATRASSPLLRKVSRQSGLSIKEMVSEKDAAGNTLLHLACRQNGNTHARLGIIRMLLQAGADVRATNNHGETPLSQVCRHSAYGPSPARLIDFLVAAGAAWTPAAEQGLSQIHPSLATFWQRKIMAEAISPPETTIPVRPRL